MRAAARGPAITSPAHPYDFLPVVDTDPRHPSLRQGRCRAPRLRRSGATFIYGFAAGVERPIGWRSCSRPICWWSRVGAAALCLQRAGRMVRRRRARGLMVGFELLRRGKRRSPGQRKPRRGVLREPVAGESPARDRCGQRVLLVTVVSAYVAFDHFASSARPSPGDHGFGPAAGTDLHLDGRRFDLS